MSGTKNARKSQRGPYEVTAFGRRIRRLRKAANLTQQELADIVGVKQAVSISRIEIGRQKSCRADLLRKLADVFETTVDRLLSERGS